MKKVILLYSVAAVLACGIVLGFLSCLVWSTHDLMMIAEPAAIGLAQIDVASGSFTLQPSLLARMQDTAAPGSLRSLAGGAILDMGQMAIIAAGTESFVLTGETVSSDSGLQGPEIETRYGDLGNQLYFTSSATTIAGEAHDWMGNSRTFGVEFRCGANAGSSLFVSMRDGLYRADAGSFFTYVPLSLGINESYCDSCPLSDGSRFVLVYDQSLGSNAVLLINPDNTIQWRKPLPGLSCSYRLFLSGANSAAVLCSVNSAESPTPILQAVSIAANGAFTVTAVYTDAPPGGLYQWSSGYWWLGSTTEYSEDGTGLVRLSPNGSVASVQLPTPPVAGIIRWVGLPDGGLIVAGPVPRMTDSYTWYNGTPTNSDSNTTPSEEYANQMSWYVYRLSSDGSVVWQQTGELPRNWVSGSGAHDGGVLALSVNAGRLSLLFGTSMLWNGFAPGYYM